MAKLSTFVEQQVDGFVKTITIKRPEVHNAFNEAVIQQLIAAFQQVSETSDIRAVVLQSQGASFCAGADLNWMKAMVNYTYDENVADAGQLAKLLRVIRTCAKPTIARVHGAAFGGGLGLIAACDMAVAVSDAKFCFSEVKLGLVPGVISPYVLEKIGASPASRYFLTAEVFDAKQAAAINLLHSVVDSTEALDEAVGHLASKVSKNSPDAVAAAKQLIIDVNQPVWLSQEKTAIEYIARQRVSEQGQEGLQAFLEKRKPNWLSE